MSRSRFTKTKADLARRIGISRPALDRLFQLEKHPVAKPDGRHDVEKWKAFADAHVAVWNKRGAAHESNGAAHAIKNLREQSIIDKNQIATRREAFRLDVEMGEYIARTVANQQVDTGNAVVMREINKAIDNELPPRLEGLSAVEIKKLLRKKFDSIFEQLPKHFEAATNRNGSK